ncbi:MAG: hypothetical protein DRJ64_08965, partial [Thermoprotei archaeon]
TPPWINKTIPKIPFVIQDKMGSYAEVGTYGIYQGWIWNDNQSFTANWSYVDAVDVYLKGIDNEGYTWVEIWKEDQKVGESEKLFLEGNVDGWIQFHLKNRTYLEHGATYWLTVKTYYQGLAWAYNKTDPYHGGFAIVDGVPKTTYDFAFKLEYYPVYPYKYGHMYSFYNSSNQIRKVAIFKDNNPWDITPDPTETILASHGISYTVFDSSDMGNVDLSQFDKVIISSDQTDATYNAISSHLSWFENYVADGGILEIHAAGQGWHDGNWSVMPGGFKWHPEYNDGVDIVTSHPILNYPNVITDDELDNWFYSAHGYLYNLPSGSQVILTSGGEPVFVISPWGSGEIIITTQTLEWGYNEGYSKFLENVILYPSGLDYLHGTWVTSKAFFHIASQDEGCMGGVGLASLQYRIWNESNGWGPWINYTEPFNISDECKHYIKIRAVDYLGNSIIVNQTHYVDNSPPTDVVDIPDVHGYYYYDGKQYIRAGKGIWINLTDMPECGVGFREATFYWNYTYTNFTMANPEVHPSGPNDDFNGFDIVEKDGKYWYVAYLDSEHNSVYISFDRECMHTIHYFYTATDWLDNEITSEIKNITLYVDSGTPIVWDDYPWHYYQPINDTAGHIRAGANFTLYAKDMPDIIKIVCIAQTKGNQTDTLQNYSAATPWQWDAQSFVAECDHINATKLYLQWFGDVNVTVYIHNDTTMNPSTALGMVTKHLTGSGEGWITFEFNPGIPLHAGETYYIEAHASPASMCSWNFTSSDEYAGGHAWISGENRSEFDWKFQIISYDPNPCASGIEGIYYGFYYKGVWHPVNLTDNTTLYGKVVNISKYYDDIEIYERFGGHYLWYAIEDNSTRDNDPRHGFVNGNVAFHEECEHDFYYWAKDNVCHHTPVYNHTFYVDATPPEVTIEMPPCYSPVYSLADKLDLVFVVDTSGSMGDEWNTLDNVMQSIINNITAQGVNLSV